MIYGNRCPATLIKRENRFVARVALENGEETFAHVPNTGRLGEIMLPGANVLLSRSENLKRKYAYTLFAVYKGDMLIHIDSAGANRLMEEALREGRLEAFPDLEHLERERTFGSSRFDFRFQVRERTAFMEVKGVTLEMDGVAMFPDAPTVRGRKHLMELIEAKKAGYDSYVIFVIQMKGPHCFTPFWERDEAFSRALCEAKSAGVTVMAYDSFVTESEILLDREIPVHLEGE